MKLLNMPGNGSDVQPGVRAAQIHYLQCAQVTGLAVA